MLGTELIYDDTDRVKVHCRLVAIMYLSEMAGLFILILFFLTAKSFVELVRYLFKQPHVKSFLSQRICQDPIENFFGCQRQRGGTHENPSVKEFVQNTQALRVVNSFCKGPARGNCRGIADTQKENEQLSQPLPKRPRPKDPKKTKKTLV